jgi:hypothetical protein
VNRVSAIRGGLLVLGGLLLLRGVWVAFTAVSSHDRIHVLIWLAAGVVIHDGLLAPISVLLGRFALPHLPIGARWGARALLAWVAAVLVIGLPLVRQAPRRLNPTVEIGHPFVGLCVAVALGIGAVIGIQTALTAHRVRATSPKAG